jgi:pyruvate/2-oxoglutarate dehydrogenase complex dihydrolipoamide dehydrogenase (E3) component
VNDRQITATHVIVATGSEAVRLGIATNAGGGLEVDEHCQVTDGLWALGDVTQVALFTHVAQYQARVVADTILGKPRRADYTAIPRVFAQPEIAAVGVTAAQARDRGLDIATTELDLAASLARPWTYETDPAGGEWIYQAALAVRAAIPIDTLLDDIAQFPTYSEAYVKAVEQLDL